MGEGTYYEILGIDVNATEDDIRKAYRKQALLWHPDKNAQRKEEAEAKFKLIAEAYEVLSDPDKKRTYDLYGEEGLKNNGSNQDYDYDFNFRPNFGFQFHDPRELFNSFFGGRDPFEMLGGNPLFGGGGGFGRMPGFGTRFDDDDFFSTPFGGNFGPTGLSSSSSYSFSSSSSGGGQGGFVSRSISTKIVNGVSTTVTKTVDAQGNETITTESGGRREVLVNNQPQEQRTIDDGRGTTNMSIQDGISYYGQRQPPQYQQSQQYHYQQPQQPQQQYQQRSVNPQQFQQRSVNPQQYQQPPQQYHQQHEYQHSKEEDHHHKKNFFNWHRKH